MKKYDKLVRDRIPEIIQAGGTKCKFRVAKENEFKSKLNDKLLEEVQEFIEKPCAEEIADVLEVVESIARVYKIDLSEIKMAKKTKKIDRGGFDKRIILESTE